MAEQAYRNMIVPDAHVELVRQITSTLAPTGGANMYTAALSADGALPATHWISSGYIDLDFANLMPLSAWALDENGDWQKTVLSEGMPEVIVALCAEAEFTVELATVTALLDAADVTMDEPFTAMARLGVQMVQIDQAAAAGGVGRS